jgi:Cu/Ag efflux protein CusF
MHETDGLKVLIIMPRTHPDRASKAPVPMRARMGTVGVILLLMGVACQRELSSQVFHVHGVVRNLGADQKSVRIMHDEIPGFMPAMTMDFEVKDPVILAKIRPDSEVNFTLEVTPDSMYLVQIESPTAQKPPPQQEESETQRRRCRHPRCINWFAPYPAPDFHLTDQDGQSLTLSGLAAVIVMDSSSPTVQARAPPIIKFSSSNSSSVTVRKRWYCSPSRLILVEIRLRSHAYAQRYQQISPAGSF